MPTSSNKNLRFVAFPSDFEAVDKNGGAIDYTLDEDFIDLVRSGVVKTDDKELP